MKPQKIEISYKTIIFTVAFIVATLIVWNLRSILILLFVCFILSEALHPLVIFLQRLKIPRALAIILIYLIIVGVVSYTLASIFPGIIEQTAGLIQILPKTISKIDIFGMKAVDIYSQLTFLDNLPGNIARFTFSLFSDIFSGFVVLVITFYLLQEKKSYSKHIISIFGERTGLQASALLLEIENRLGHWVNAEIMLMFTIGLLSYIGYLVLGLNYALPLAIIAGALEAVPNIGPTVAAILAAIVGLSVSPLVAALAVVWGIIVQQLENNFVVPKIMSDRVGLHPIVTIVLIASGAKLAGIMGALLVIPFFLTIQTIYRFLAKK